MAIITASNSSAPNTLKWATTDGDVYDRATQLAGLAENFDLHDHSDTKNLGVKRLQTSVAPTASGHVRVNGDTLQWWGGSSSAVVTAVDNVSAQTIAGAKTFSSAATFTLGLTTGQEIVASGVTDLGLRSNSSVVVQIDHDNTTTSQTFSVRTDAGVTDIFQVFETGEVRVTNTTSPKTNDAAALGSGTLMWSDLFLASGAVVNFNNGDVTLTHSADLLTLGGGSFAIGTTPADAGTLRLASGATVRFRNNANTANITVLSTDVTDGTTLNGSTALALTSGGDVSVTAGSITGLSVGTTGTTTLDQGANDGEILAFKSSDVAHGVTGITATSTYSFFRKYDGATGGVDFYGLSENELAVNVIGVVTNANTTKSTLGLGAVNISTQLKSGSSAGAMSADANLLSVKNNNTTRFILDGDGDSHQDVGTAWTNFDDYDDPRLLTALSVAVSRPGDPIKEQFRQVLEDYRGPLERARLVTFNEDGHHFVNMSRLTMALVGAVRQVSDRLVLAESRLAALHG